MRLSELLDGLDYRRASEVADPECAGLAYDSRRVTPGMVFFALPGEKTDGHDHAADAAARGAVAVVAERDCGLPPDVAQVFAANTRKTMALAAARFHRNPSRDLKVIGITGTNGKTTVAHLARHVLKQAGLATGLLGTVEYDVGERVLPAARTTPEALELQQLLAQMRDADCAVCVMEVSSHALAQHRVDAIEFDAALFTNLTQDHLDYHGDMEAYFATKRQLLDGLKNKAAAIVNLDDPFGARLAGEPVLTFGHATAATVRAVDFTLGATSTHLTVQTPDGSLPVSLPLIGRHNISNALAAFCIARLLGVGPDVIAEALASAPPVPGRLESIVAGQPFGVFVDYAHTDDALRQVLKTLREIASGRLLVAFGCGGNRDAGKRRQMGAAAAEWADEIIITTDNPRHEDPAIIAGQVVAGCRATRADGFEIELDRARAIDEIIRRARPGDTVLIAGKGHETCQEMGNTVMPFDDREQARQMLAALGFGQ
jgi:UDP-N-acetylmuramoyl-L-alanyl-D-glutamate--2,6-diaminopimelate ligase